MGSGHHSLVSGEQFANRHALHSSSLWLHQKASVEAQMVKNLPAMQETQVGSLGREDPLEKGMATTPVVLPGNAMDRGALVGYSSQVRKQLDMT